VVAYTPAGTTDILARVIGQKMTENWGQPVIIDNRPGANGNIGTEYAAKATPDGHTVLMTTAGPHGINPSLYRKIGFDAVKDFAPITLVAIVPNILVVNNGLPVKDVKELIAHAKANPGKLNYGSPGAGQHRASLDGAFQIDDRYQSRARPVQGQCGRHERSDRRPDRGHDGQHAAVSAAGESGKDPRARRDARPSALPQCPICPRSPKRVCADTIQARGSVCSRPQKRRRKSSPNSPPRPCASSSFPT
jgi:hypothetical protein